MASSQLQDQSGEEGWYLQGEPAITKDQEADLPPCYTGRTIEVSNGRVQGSEIISSSPECFPHGGAGTFSGDVTWNPPPSYLEPGTTIDFSVTCTWTGPENDLVRSTGLIGWNFGSGGTTIVDADSRYPQPSKGSCIVPEGSAGDEMNVYVIAAAVSGLFGNIVYKYKYQGGVELPPAAQPTDAPLPSSDKTYCCEGSCSHKKWWSESGSSQGSGEKLRIMADSGVRFSGLTGQVSIRPESDEDAWRGAGLKSVINLYDHVRTGEDSQAILSFPDMTTFIMKPESEVIIDTPPERDSKWKLICGKVKANVKRMMKDGTMELPMSQAVTGIKGTTIVCEETGRSSTLKVLEGSASFKSRATSEEILLNAGEMATATSSGLSAPESFDVEAENESWMEHIVETEVPTADESTVIYNSWNTNAVDNGPTCSPFFTIDEPMMITYIDTYHWNYGQGAPGGTIGLRDGDGTVHGPWQAESSGEGGEVPRGYWIAHPNEVIPVGSYTIEDSDPDTWSQNSESPCGLARVEGYAVESSPSQESGVLAADTKEAMSKASNKGTSSHPPAAESADLGVDGSQGRGFMVQEKISDAGTHPPGTEKTISSPAMEGSTTAKPEQTLMEESAYPAPSDGSVVIRGQVATGDFKWTAQNFAGFYYDPESEMGTEVLTATLTDGKLSGSQPFGLYYQTTAQRQDFAFRDWGSYQVMGFLGEKCFAWYVDGSDSGKGYLFEKSSNKSALAKGQLCKVLLDNDEEQTITSKIPVMLEEGYRLELKAVNPDDGRTFVELRKGNQLVDNNIVQPSKDEATLSDKTYYFRNPSEGLVTIAVHFKNAFAGSDQNLATIDGIWQLSESPISVARGTSFDKLTVSEVTDRSLVMNNIDQTIILDRDKNVLLAGDMHIRTADSNLLRYYLVKEVSI